MAELNPNVANTKQPNFISDQSEQPKSAQYNATADKSFGDSLMEGLTNVIPPLAEAGDRLTKLAIDNSIYDQNDKLNREFGATDTIALNNAKVPSVPSALEDSAKNLQRISGAYQSGAISKTTFDVKVASMASDLRAQYSSPYLRDYIDKKVQDVTGVDPQNQVRKDIFEAVNKNKNDALEQEHKKQSLAADLAKAGVGVPGWEKMTYPELINATAGSQRYKDNTDRWKAANETRTAQDSITDADHDREVQNSAKAIVVQSITNVNSALGKTKAQLDAQFKNISSMSGQQKAQLIASAQQFHDKVVGDTRVSIGQNWTGSKPLDTKHLDDLMTPTREYMDNWLGAYTSGNEQALKAMDDEIKMLKFKDDAKFLTVDKTRMAAAAYRNLGSLAGSAAMEKWLPQILKDGDRVFARDQLVQMYGDGPGIPTVDAYRQMRDNGTKSKQAFDAVTRIPGSIIEDARAQPEEVEKSVRSLYGADNYQFIAGLNDQDKVNMYGQLYSPDRTKAMERVRDSGDMNSWNMYVTSAKRMFGATFRQGAQNMQRNAMDPDRFRVTYNANTHQFQFDPTLSNFSRVGQPIAVPAHPELDYINAGIKAITPVLESNGQNVEDFLQRQFQESGMTGPAGGWRKSDNMWEQVGGAYMETNAAVNIQNGASKLGGPESSSSEGSTNRQEQLDTRTGILSEMKDVQALYNKADTPEEKARFGKMLDDLNADYTGARASVSPTFGGPKPRGEPATGTPTDEQQSNARDVIDTLTGIPSFIEAVKKGDMQGAALAAATVLPFPGGRMAKGAGEAIEGGAKIIDNVTREARGAAKGLEAQAAREASVIQELRSVDVSKLSDEGLANVENQLRTGLASKSLNTDQISAIFDKIKEVSIELGRRTPLTPAEQVMRDSNLKTLQSLERDQKLAKNKGLEVIDGGKQD